MYQTSLRSNDKWILKTSKDGKQYRYYYKARPEYFQRGPGTYNRTCSKCGEKTTKIQPPKGHNRYPTELWTKDGNGGWKCWKCKNRENSRSYKHKQLRYKKLLLTYKTPIRNGKCQNCGFMGKTVLHHTAYDDNDPLAHTVEVCWKCHAALHLLSIGTIVSFQDAALKKVFSNRIDNTVCKP